MTELLLTELLTLDAGIFHQIRVPTIEADEYDDRLAKAEAGTIGYVVAPDATRHDTIWLIVLERENLWRWSIVDANLFDSALGDHRFNRWLPSIPQIFLTGGQAWTPK